MRGTKKLLSIAALVLSLVMSLALFAGCGDHKKSNGKTDNLDDATLDAEKIADFTLGESENVFASDGWANGSVFNVVWSKDNVTYSDGAMHLGITEQAAAAYLDDELVEFDYTAGEARTTMHYGFGDYAVSMKPAKKAGTASTFFVCTGNYETVDEVPNEHDEIDIEFLGKDTTKVQFNYFVNGKGGNEYMYDLGFDASEQYHEYGFRWAEDHIVWFVDGEPVYRVDKTKKYPMPTHPGRILMNYWCGTQQAEGWMGKFTDASTGETADYQWIKVAAEASQVDQDIPSDPDVPTDELTFTAFDMTNATWSGNLDVYTMNKSSGSVEVDYTNLAGNSYANINTEIGNIAADKDAFKVTLQNKGAEQANVRIDINSQQQVNNTNACNVSARVEGEGATAYTDTDWGGTTVTLDAGATATVTVYFDNTRTPTTLILYFDSCKYDDVKTHTGKIVLSDAYFGAKAGQGQGGQGGQTEQQGTPLDLTAVTIDGNLDVYTLNKSGGELEATYTNLAGNSYANINTDVASVAAGATSFTVTIENKGSQTATVRIDINSQRQVNNTYAANTDAKVEGNGATVYTDTNWGGSIITINAGAKITVTVTYDNTRTPTLLFFYFDSCLSNDGAAHTGKIVLSNAKFN